MKAGRHGAGRDVGTREHTRARPYTSREPRCERHAASAKERRRWCTNAHGTSRRSDAGDGRVPPQPGGLGRSASPRIVARRRRSTPPATPSSSRLARLAAEPSAAAGGLGTGSKHVLNDGGTTGVSPWGIHGWIEGLCQRDFGPLAQLVELGALNATVDGSTPSRPTNF